MAKQQALQKYVFKIHSSKLRKAKWNLNLTIQEALNNNEIISLSDSTTLQFINDLNNVTNAEEKAREIRKEIKRIKKLDDAYKYKKVLKKLYEQLNEVQLKKDYLCVIIDKTSDYIKMCKDGFYFNGVKYSRLMSTTNGVKHETIIFTSVNIKNPLREKLENGRDKTKKFVPNKYSAYEALSCTASIPVYTPEKMLVVNDVYTTFTEDVIRLDDSESEEPKMEYVKDYVIEKCATDGFGLMSPKIAKLWAEQLKLDYIPSGLNTRYSFEKGMLVTFDFHMFADEYADGNYIVKDAWGDLVDIRDVDVVLTTSMLKLWNSYSSWDDYKSNCDKHGYKFRIAKTVSEVNDNERNLNYQFIQSYELNDEDIHELVKPTIDYFKDVLNLDRNKSLLFLRGENMNEKNAFYGESNFVKALMIDERLKDDPFVMGNIKKMLQKQINQAKTGVIKVSGNYQIACGDPFILCEGIFGLEPKGILKKGEFYSKYWIDKQVDEVVCFRAPMTCHNNIRKLNIVTNKEAEKWYKYITNMLIFNSWDSTAEAENGEDFDADQNFTSDNEILLKRFVDTPTIFCIQRAAKKILFNEDDLIKADVSSFGDEIGMYTNGITSQFDILSLYEKGTKEYEELKYRIMCGQMFQQNAIDKTKGIIARDRPSSWYNIHPNICKESDTKEEREKKEFYFRLVADKKPYFMRYIYPNLMKEYNEYMRKINASCESKYRMTLEELINKKNKTKQELDFIKFYKIKSPVSIYDCVVNKICRIFENEFDGYIKRYRANNDFDYSILKTSAATSKANYKKILSIYNSYCEKVRIFNRQSTYQRLDEADISEERMALIKLFKEECSLACPNENELCNILIDICYSSTKSKQFVWDICGDVIIKNLLEKNNNTISYPIRDDNGLIEFNGHKFSIHTQRLEEIND